MKQLTLEITQKCMNNCLHCSSLASLNSCNELKLEVLLRIIKEAQELKIEEICISGGEPFLHKDLVEIVKCIKDNKIKAFIYTSGLSLDKFGNVVSLDKEVLKSLKSIDKIIFNLPAISESIYDKFMGTKGYQKLVFESIKKTKELGIYTEVHFVPTKVNINEIEKVLDFCEEHKIDKLSFLRFIPHGRGLYNRKELELSESETDTLKIKLGKLESRVVRVGIPLEQEKKCCYAVKDKLVIRYDGKVFGCEAFKNKNLAKDDEVDSIYDKSLNDIYVNSEHLKLEREFIKKRLEKMGCCENCPIQVKD